MPVITQITTHEEDQRARLLSQFKDKPLIEAILNAIGEQVQDYEDATIELNELLNISTQVGVQLDGIGTIVGEARGGLSDPDYRTALYTRIAALYGSGTGEDVIAAYVNATGATQVDLRPNYPAGLDIDGDVAEPAGLIDTLEASAAAGVHIGLLDLFIWNDDDPALWNDGDTIYLRHDSSG